MVKENRAWRIFLILIHFLFCDSIQKYAPCAVLFNNELANELANTLATRIATRIAIRIATRIASRIAIRIATRIATRAGRDVPGPARRGLARPSSACPCPAQPGLD